MELMDESGSALLFDLAKSLVGARFNLPGNRGNAAGDAERDQQK
jgi:hypothetical protein